MSKIKITNISIDELKPAEYNPRVISNVEQQKLKQSLETFGLTDPIIIDTNTKTIIGGNQRYEILREVTPSPELLLINLGNIGWVIQKDISINDKNDFKALAIAFNSIHGEWDYDKLNNLFIELQELPDINLTDTGFTLDELDNFESLYLTENKINYDPHSTITTEHTTIYLGPIKITCSHESFINLMYSIKNVSKDKGISPEQEIKQRLRIW